MRSRCTEQRDSQYVGDLRVVRRRRASRSRTVQGHSVDRGHRSERLDSLHRGQLSLPGRGVSTLWAQHHIIIIIIIINIIRTTVLSHILLGLRTIHSFPDNRGSFFELQNIARRPTERTSTCNSIRFIAASCMADRKKCRRPCVSRSEFSFNLNSWPRV